MQKTKLKIALFGFGKMGLRHARAIKLQDCANLKAISDPFVDQSRIAVLLPEKIEVFSSPEVLLQRVKPDVVHICAPPNTHTTLAKLALKYGSNIYVEKPFALESAEAESVLSFAQELGLKVCAGHQLLFENPTGKVKEFLKDTGRIVHVESYFSFHPVRRSASPVDQLIDILPHPVYLLLHFLNSDSKNQEEDRIELLALDVKSSGEVHGILRAGETSGVLVVTLQGRPIESYLRIVGTNGCLYADFVRGAVTKISGPGSSAVSIVLNPYRQAKQILVGTTKALASRALTRQKSYPGLSKLIEAFYASILKGSPPPLTTSSIIETVSICEAIGKKLRDAEAEVETHAKVAFEGLERDLAPPDPNKDRVLVTGGTGFLGAEVVTELRNHGWPVRVIARHKPPYSARIPGVEYATADLGDEVPSELLNGIVTVVHCAAETAGGKEAHERNTVRGTYNILYAAAKAGVKKFVHISSLAVLKTSREIGGPIDEVTPIDIGNLSRGPYVWAKAKSERRVRELGEKLGMSVRVIRLGPLLDFEAFEAPGRLGREIGPYFVAVGGRHSTLSVCEVHTAAQVIRSYVHDYDGAPPILNLVEPDALTRAELVAHLLKERPDLKAFWVPDFVLTVMSPLLKVLQRLIRPGKKPIDIPAAFGSESYKSDLAATVIKKARQAP